MNLRLDYCDHLAASYAVKHWHYSGTMPRTKVVKIGVWEDAVFTGVVLFSWGSCNNLLKPYGLSMIDGCELTRIALSEHQSTVSKIVSIAIKMLKINNPGLRLIVSFADPMQKHLGIIYQAGNWVYTGESHSTPLYRDKFGKMWHSRNVGKDITKRAIMVTQVNCTEVKVPDKHRYLYPLDKAMRKQIEPLRKPYPKRLPQKHQGDAACIPAGRGRFDPDLAAQVSTVH